jgi:DNA-binding transcriptional MerR regulator
MTIGHFSRSVRLSAKSLRRYHEQGVLTPAVVDDRNGYRLYAPGQLADAQIVRTLRQLDVPLESIRAVLDAPSVELRSQLLAEHLEGMERKLDETRDAVATLRGMLEQPRTSIEITHRSVPESRVIAVQSTIALSELGRWFRRAVGELETVAAALEPGSTGPLGGVWSNELFEDEYGAATLYLTVRDDVEPTRVALGSATVLELPAVELAVATHRGSDETVAAVYAALGEYVARHELATDAPLRETYVSGLPGIDARSVTEIGWPIFRIAR